MILRGVTTVQVQSMRPWLRDVVFDTQYASRQGVLEAVGSLNTYAEAVCHRAADLWAKSITTRKCSMPFCMLLRLKLQD